MRTNIDCVATKQCSSITDIQFSNKLNKDNTIKNTSDKDIVKFHEVDNKKSSYRKNYVGWDDIERANKPKNYTEKTKYLGKSAKDLLALLFQKLKKENRIFLNHKYISKITKCRRRQNQNIINELKNILDIQYHNSFLDINTGKKYRFCYEFSFKKSPSSKCDIINTKLLNKTAEINISIGQKNSSQNGDIYVSKENNKNRSIDSSESESNFVKLENNETQTQIESDDKIEIDSPVSTGLSKIKKIFFRNPLKLKDFYPILPEDCSLLRMSSNRNFTDIAINEILQNIAIKLDKHEFRSKKTFMNYMSKVLIAEMRDEVKVSGKDFKINANLSPEIRKKKKAEEYLNKVELSHEVSQEMHFKKKLAGALDPIKAYEVLNAYKFCSIKTTDSGGAKFIMHLNSRVELQEIEKEIILKQAKATHETYEQGEIKSIDKLQIDMPSVFASEYQKRSPQNNNQKTKEFTGLWGLVCKELITRYGWDIYHSWFDKLEAKIEAKTKTIKLKAPTKFIRDWIERDYLDVIDKSCSKVGINLTGISTISAG